MQSVFVDLSNFYGQLLKSGAGTAKELKRYFLEWLDFDVLAQCLTGETQSVWIFYSGRRIGPSSERIDGSYLTELVKRLDAQKGVTTRDANISGEQRETAIYSCEKCGTSGVAEWTSEKGVDASLTVQLFDTMDSWDVAYLLSGDADFVPAVMSLRRRGKVVIGAGFSGASPALIRECYTYVDLVETFVRLDFLAYKVMGAGGIAEQWLTRSGASDEVGQYDFNLIDRSRPWSSRGDSSLVHDDFVCTLRATNNQTCLRIEQLVAWLKAYQADENIKISHQNESGSQGVSVRFSGPGCGGLKQNTRVAKNRLRALPGVSNWGDGGRAYSQDRTIGLALESS